MTEEQLLSAALAHSPESVSIYGLDGTVLYMNPATERIMDARLAELRGKRLFELYPAAIGKTFHAAFERIAAGGAPESFEHYLPGSASWFAARVMRLDDRVHVYAREVTDDVRHRAETSSLRNRLSALADAIPALVSFVDRDERYQYVNAGYERWFGAPRCL